MNVLWKVLLVLGVASLAVYWSHAADKGHHSRGDRPVKLAAAPRRPLTGVDTPFHGIAWQIHHSQGCVELARKMLGEIADVGADTVLISNAGYQKDAGSETFQVDPKVTPSAEEWQQIFKIAHDNGLRVILMPIVLLSDPRGTEWRGVISPPSWDEWFDKYREFIRRFAEIAEANKVEVFSVGSELVSTERYTDRWRSVIKETRAVFKGKLTYSSNWDHYKVVEFWDDLDYVGMTTYYKLSNEPNPKLASLIDAWQPIKRGLMRWQDEIGKPLIFTEVGWSSQEGASIEPWNYYYKQVSTEKGLAEQLNCYKAFMEAWKDELTAPKDKAPLSVIWWEWMNVEGGPEDYSYIPKGKPAEVALRDWFKEMRERFHPSAASKPSEALHSSKP